MRDARVVGVGFTAAAMGSLYGLVVHSQIQMIDHIGFRDTVVRMRSGQNFYSAYLDAFRQDFGVAIGQPRGIRAPTIFLLWRWIPDDRLYLAFLAFVVVLTAVLLALAVPDRPYAALAPAAYLLVAGRSITQPRFDAWLMCELWAVPALAGGILAWRRGRDGPAVACVVLAVLIREIAAVALVVGFVVARVEHRPRRPWLVGAGVATAAWILHLALATASMTGSGGVAPLRGTAHFPRTVIEMMSWNAPRPTALFALTAFGGAALALWRRRDLAIAAMTLPVPALGLLVARNYWGMLAVPFAWWLTAIAVDSIFRPTAVPEVSEVDAPSLP